MSKLITILLLLSAQMLPAQFLRGQALSAKQTQQVNQMITTAINPLKVDIASLKVSVAKNGTDITALNLQTSAFANQITTLQNQLIITNGNVSDLKTQVTALTLKSVSQQKTIDSITAILRKGIKVQGGGKVLNDSTLIIQAVYDNTCKCFKPIYQ